MSGGDDDKAAKQQMDTVLSTFKVMQLSFIFVYSSWGFVQLF